MKIPSTLLTLPSYITHKERQLSACQYAHKKQCQQDAMALDPYKRIFAPFMVGPLQIVGLEVCPACKDHSAKHTGPSSGTHRTERIQATVNAGLWLHRDFPARNITLQSIPTPLSSIHPTETILLA